ncbi:MAG: hypothetical protein NW237_12155 [Cyanobacteriota bacterium]|nr:hypothetical protein [Cyanobacteriota bacterium]
MANHGFRERVGSSALLSALRSAGIPALIMVGSLVGVVTLQMPLVQQVKEPDPNEEITRFNQSTALASVLQGLGYGNLASGWLWLEFIQYYGDVRIRSQKGYDLADDYLDKMTQADPRFLLAYRIASLVLAYRAAEPDEAVALLDRATQYITPDWIPEEAWKLYVDRALLNFLFLGDPEAAKQDYFKAAEWYEKLYPGYGNQWRDLGESLANKEHIDRIRFDVWMSVFNASDDPETREFVFQELLKLGRVVRLPSGEMRLVPPPLPGELTPPTETPLPEQAAPDP